MVVSTKKTKTLAQKVFNGICQNCKTENSVNIFITVNYTAVYNIIPVFPSKKSGTTICSHCIKTYDIDDSMEEELCASFQEIYNETKIPYSLYIGTIILFLILAYALIEKIK